MERPLEVAHEDGIVTARLNRPHALNAISSAMAEALQSLLDDIDGRRDARVLVLTSAGDRAFSAGADLKERRTMTPAELWAHSRKIHRVCDLLERLPQPVVCAIRGYCLGGGLELALAADIRVAAEQSEFGFPEMTLGAFPGAGGPVRLPRVVGPAWAKEILLTARRLRALEALERGLVHYVVPIEQVDVRAREIARRILRVSPLGARAVKQIVNRGIAMGTEEATALANALRQPLEATRDYQEGLRAHFEKREPRFIGE
jgi:enoyl-CoA hydratase/carnithine racemase